jgi:hypothetical protein
MKFGLHYLLSCADDQSVVRRYEDTIEQAVYAEELGFESVDKARLLAIVAQMRNTNFARVNDGMGIFDDPQGCAIRLRALQNRLGFGRLIGWFNFGGMIPHHRASPPR